MTRTHLLCRMLLIAVCLAVNTPLGLAQGEKAAEPGPQNGGLRLRLTLTRAVKSAEWEVRMDLINDSQQSIALQTAWESSEPGDVKDYLQAAAQIETTPYFAPEHGATGFSEARTEQQKTLNLPANESLELRWRTGGPRLKPERQNSLLSANPALDEAGLYSVRVVLDVPTATGTVRLRSNEQLVSVGGSVRAPKPSAARLESVSRDLQSVRIDLGGLDQVARGDQFDFTSKTAAWRITITDTHPHSSEGTLQLLSSELGSSRPQVGEFVTRVRAATAAK